MGELSVLNYEGDTKTIWDSDNKDEVENAKKQFDFFSKKGFTAFSVGKDDDKDDKITKFDPKLEKIIFVPRIVGG